MRSALSIALQEYEGAMLLVSHDRFLVRATVDQLMLVANGEMKPFTGDLDEYEKWLLDYRRQSNTSDTSQKEQRKSDNLQRDASRALLQKIKTLEKQLEKLQLKL